MCGNHDHSAQHRSNGLIGPGPVGHRRPRQLHRRAFLGYFGKGTAALALLGPVAAACGSTSSTTTNAEAGTTTTAASGSAQTGTSSSTTAAPAEDGTTTGGGADATGQWARADLGFVSAYVLARNSELAIVDTGVAGSAEAIGQTISDLGFTYDDVRHVVLTHSHGDHAGSIKAVLESAGNATGYAGEPDLGSISGVDLTPISDGQELFGMQIVASPGHTAGHMSVFDELTSTLVVGDAMNGADGGVAGANPQFTPDMATAAESIKKMAQLQFDTIYFGHGEPVIGGASDAVKDLANQL